MELNACWGFYLQREQHRRLLQHVGRRATHCSIDGRARGSFRGQLRERLSLGGPRSGPLVRRPQVQQVRVPLWHRLLTDHGLLRFQAVQKSACAAPGSSGLPWELILICLFSFESRMKQPHTARMLLINFLDSLSHVSPSLIHAEFHLPVGILDDSHPPLISWPTTLDLRPMSWSNITEGVTYDTG